MSRAGRRAGAGLTGCTQQLPRPIQRTRSSCKRAGPHVDRLLYTHARSPRRRSSCDRRPTTPQPLARPRPVRPDNPHAGARATPTPQPGRPRSTPVPRRAAVRRRGSRGSRVGHRGERGLRDVEGVHHGARKHAAVDGVLGALRRQHVGKLHEGLSSLLVGARSGDAAAARQPGSQQQRARARAQVRAGSRSQQRRRAAGGSRPRTLP